MALVTIKLMVHNHPLHKLRKRGKQHKKNAFDYLVHFFMVVTPLFELPQAWDIYRSHSADNVSLLTWTFFFLSSFVWLGYGIHHRIKPFIVMYTLYLIVEASVIVGILAYG